MEFVIPRQAKDELIFATVKAMATGPAATGEVSFLQALTHAVTEWVKSSMVGAKAWVDSRQDFNVGDLRLWMSDVTLIECLSKNGIQELSIRKSVV